MFTEITVLFVAAVWAPRANWRPAPVSVTVERLSFFDQPAFHGCTPVLAAACHVSGIDYRWKRGVRYALGGSVLAPANGKGQMTNIQHAEVPA